MKFFVLSILYCSFSFATVTIGKIDCPVQFEGRAVEIMDQGGRTGPITTFNVVFKTLEVIKGEVNDFVTIELLQNGPFKIEQGEDYRVQLRNGRICWIEKN